jgi:hypothetical protein
MRKFRFIIKPVFYILSLVFATWLVITIEKVSPSDFNSSKDKTNEKMVVPPEIQQDKIFLENLCKAYRAGTIDSSELGKRLLWYLKSKKDLSRK